MERSLRGGETTGAGARDIPNKFGNTALSMARANNHNDVVQYLLQHQPK
ncbi:hypothetical protein GBAR_LOCUS11346 [Geodia barretti]|uniref:Uncharacterized protein n=1 Tax=Geodia barretti TaxID=519541 RepID=A0AA35RY59_GEOBA|nr:hypothetical protein GBAR_LOCUS11346 [Geodia barretti]